MTIGIYGDPVKPGDTVERPCVGSACYASVTVPETQAWERGWLLRNDAGELRAAADPDGPLCRDCSQPGLFEALSAVA